MHNYLIVIITCHDEPFKASDGTINVFMLRSLNVHCVVCDFIKLYKYDFKVISYVMPTCTKLSL